MNTNISFLLLSFLIITFFFTIFDFKKRIQKNASNTAQKNTLTTIKQLFKQTKTV